MGKDLEGTGTGLIAEDDKNSMIITVVPTEVRTENRSAWIFRIYTARNENVG
jgi:hypothetical protein